MVDNRVRFVALIVAARAARADATTGASIFFFARLACVGLWLAGVVYVRSLAWIGLGRRAAPPTRRCACSPSCAPA